MNLEDLKKFFSEDEKFSLTRVFSSGAGLNFDFISSTNEKKFSIETLGVVESSVMLEERNFLFSTISFVDGHPLLWDYGAFSAIFCSAPLPDPYRFFTEFYELIVGKYGLARNPTKYLNWRGSLSLWLEIAYSRTFNLFSGPTELAEAVCELLDIQAAEYNLLPEPQDELGNPYKLLAFGKSSVICEEVKISNEQK